MVSEAQSSLWHRPAKGSCPSWWKLPYEIPTGLAPFALSSTFFRSCRLIKNKTVHFLSCKDFLDLQQISSVNSNSALHLSVVLKKIPLVAWLHWPFFCYPLWLKGLFIHTLSLHWGGWGVSLYIPLDPSVKRVTHFSCLATCLNMSPCFYFSTYFLVNTCKSVQSLLRDTPL